MGKVIDMTNNDMISCCGMDCILGTRDPKLSEEEFMKTVEERVNRLKGNI